ncbi:MAG: ribosome recycling factor [Candidatus Liptonbacteria bacterium]|nr:ribosome recycling factor [Candidatus Liptonbacteria bacterium]
MIQTDKNLKELEISLKNSIDALREELQGVRGNRPSVEILENIKVSCYDQIMSIKQLGSLNLRPPREIELQVWDKNAIPAIVKAIEDAKLGMSVSNDGNVVRISLPTLTDERRKELSKLAGKVTETFRIRLRNNRDESIKKFKAAEENGEITEDELFEAKEKTQKLIDEANRKIDEILGNKVKEIEE